MVGEVDCGYRKPNTKLISFFLPGVDEFITNYMATLQSAALNGLLIAIAKPEAVLL